VQSRYRVCSFSVKPRSGKSAALAKPWNFRRGPVDYGIEITVQAVIRSRSTTRRLASIAGLAALASAFTVPAAQAQQAPQGAIVIPDDVKIFGADNPNMRRATAVVNGDVITGTDVDQRLALIVAANQGKIDEEEMKRLRLQVLRNLIDETLQIQEAKASEIEIAQSEVDQSYARVATQSFNQNTGAMDAYLKRIGSSADSLKRQIRGELSWQRLLQRNVSPFVNVSDDEVNEMLDRLKAAKGTDEYRLGEIYLAASPDARQQVYENATQIVQQLRQGGSFTAYARQYSQASTAAVGGDLGWIRLAQLPGELQVAAREMQPGQLVGPIEVPGGFDIIYLIDKRQVLTADPRDAVLALKQISISFPKGTTEAQAGQKAEAFAKAISGAKGCGNVDSVATGIGAQVVANDQVRARDLPGPIQKSILELSPGETLPPFGSLDDGVRILMLCGRDDPQVESGPSFEQLQAQIEEDRVNKRAQTYLRDLRRDAVIEYN
jgi:peptidyl-prolyl cis-trans isomerase SurA